MALVLAAATAAATASAATAARCWRGPPRGGPPRLAGARLPTSGATGWAAHQWGTLAAVLPLSLFSPGSAVGGAALLWPWAEARAAAAALLLAGALAMPAAAGARDGTVAPPTCVAILDAATNCPPRPRRGGISNAQAQLKAAEARLAEAEQQAGKKLALGESQGGEPEMVGFWQAELKRLAMNQDYLQDLRSQIFGAPGESSQAAQSPRFVSRLTFKAADVEKEAKFWCEAVGMQRYATLPGGGAVVAYGPPGLLPGEEGGYFAVEILPSQGGSSQLVPDTARTTRLSFVQIATPSLIRISRVIASGGQLIDGYGYYGIRSPAGVQIRAYVDDRRDPVEFVALAANRGELAAAGRSLEALGLRPRSPYQNVSPATQEYMPALPDGNMLYAGGDAKQAVQLLLLPVVEEAPKSFLQQLPRGPSLVINSDSRPEFDVLEQKEEAETPISEVRASLTVLVPAAAAAGAGASDAGDAGGAASFSLGLAGAA